MTYDKVRMYDSESSIVLNGQKPGCRSVFQHAACHGKALESNQPGAGESLKGTKMVEQKLKVHFVIPDERVWPELRDGGSSRISGERLNELSGGILNSWLLRTCYHLRQNGFEASIGPTTIPDAANFASPRDFGRRERNLDHFLVIPRGDAHWPMLANFVVLQNGVIEGKSPNTAVVAHWPQPGIIRRDEARGTQVKIISFKGRTINFAPSLRTEKFREDIKKIGMVLEFADFSTLTGDHRWHDYSQTDVVLAVRNLTRYDISKKPASKLVNAWFGEAPALLGPEPAFRELWKSPLDYIEVNSRSEIFDCLIYMRDNPNLYLDMVANGCERRKNFEEDIIAQTWIDVLNGPVADSVGRWYRRPKALRRFSAIAGIAAEKPSRRLDRYRFVHGLRTDFDAT